MNIDIKKSQNAVWELLSRSITNNKIGNAYLFSGPAGCGKEAMAIEFGAEINRNYHKADHELAQINYNQFKSLQHELLKIIFPLPTGKSQKDNTNPLNALKSTDLELVRQNIEQKSLNPFHKIILPGATRILINSIRDLRKSLYLKSNDVGRKIVLLFEAHLLSAGQAESANALLKILEEPPNNTTLILVTDNKNQLLPTILSRCQQIDFPPLTKETIKESLHNFNVIPDLMDLVADISQGNMHKAIKLSEKSGENLISQIANIANSILTEDGKNWRDFINTTSKIIRSDFAQFQYNILLLQLWFKSAYRLRLGLNDALHRDELLDFMNQFNNQYPHADIQKIIVVLEESIDAAGKNLYMSLILTNLLINIQKLLK